MELRWPSKRQLRRIVGRSCAGKVIRALVTLQVLWNWVIWLLDWKSRIEDAIKTLGELGVVLNVIMSPWFGCALVLVGLFYFIFVSDEDHPSASHPVLGARIKTVFSWVAVVLFLLLLWGEIVVVYVAVSFQQVNAGMYSKSDYCVKFRSLTPDQIKVIGDHLKQHPPHIVTIVYSVDDGEAGRYVEYFQKAFTEGRWKVRHDAKRPDDQSEPVNIRPGVELEYFGDGEKSPIPGGVVEDALREVADFRRMKRHSKQNPKYGDFGVVLTIGEKPNLLGCEDGGKK